MSLNILFGIQGTGNGHISRSREVVRELKTLGHKIQCVFSGREPALLRETELFKPFQALPGLTFVTERGKIRLLRSVRHLNFPRLYRDIGSFDSQKFDLVITDFEPITARVAKRNKIPSIGIGHQYAFTYKIPKAGYNPVSSWILNHFAFADVGLGLHWHHFNQPILPPIIPHMDAVSHVIADKILIYLPFEHLDDIYALLKPFDLYQFYIYGHAAQAQDRDHFHLRPFSRTEFLNDLRDCSGIVTNAGFETIAEAIHLKKKVLVKPVQGQMEQCSNALAVTKLKIGMSMKKLDPAVLTRWLDDPTRPSMQYPNVARLIARWIDAGSLHDVPGLAHEAWKQTSPEFAHF